MANIKTHNTSKSINADGTFLQGNTYVSYEKLVKTFGKPTSGDGYKTKAEWLIKDVKTGVVATIYDWKSDVAPANNSDWHIGGYGRAAVKLVEDCLSRGAR